jgi:BASS family bile acid:Na+ symporter
MGRRSALTVGFASGNRNMGLLLAVLPAESPPDVLLFFVLAQLPIYILPAVLGPAYRRWLC